MTKKIRNIKVIQSIVWVIFATISYCLLKCIWNTDKHELYRKVPRARSRAIILTKYTNGEYSFIKNSVYNDISHLFKCSLTLLLITSLIIFIIGFFYNYKKSNNLYHLCLFDYVKRQFISICSYVIAMISLFIAVMGGLIALDPSRFLVSDFRYFTLLLSACPYIIYISCLITIKFPKFEYHK